MSRILIAGCGYVGTALGLALVERGEEVVALRRRSEGLPRELEAVTADLCSPATLERIAEPFDAVFYTAAAESGDDEGYRRAYVEGLSNLIAVVERSPAPRRLFLCSSTRVYPQTGGEWIDEDSPTAAIDFRSHRLLEGEALATGAPFATTIVRLAGIYGPGRDRLLRRLLEGAPLAAGNSQRYTNRIHRDDCVGILLHLLDLQDPADLYLGVDGEPSRLETMQRWLRARVSDEGQGAGSDSGTVPPSPREGAVAPPPAEPASNKRCSNARLVATGYEYRFPTFREGYAALLRDRRCAETELVK